MFYYLCESKGSEFRQGLFQEFHTKLQPILGEDFMTTIADSFRQEGRKVGRQEGLEHGLENGMHLAKLEDAYAMLAEGISESVVAKVTKLSLNEIRSEAKKLNPKKNTHH